MNNKLNNSKIQKDIERCLDYYTVYPFHQLDYTNLYYIYKTNPEYQIFLMHLTEEWGGFKEYEEKYKNEGYKFDLPAMIGLGFIESGGGVDDTNYFSILEGVSNDYRITIAKDFLLKY